MKTALVLALVASLSGCYGVHSSSRVVVLQNPETKQTVDCRVDGAGRMNYKAQIDDCMAAYAKAGYVKVGDSAD